MSKAVIMRPRSVHRANLSFAIVASQYNAEFVQPMVDNAQRELNLIEPGAPVIRVASPGAFEIPLLVQALAELARYDAIIALGVILRGATDHADLIARSVTQGLLELSLKFHTPVIHEVLLLSSREQAHERCIALEHNRGIEAARAAVLAARTLRGIK